MGGFVAVNAYLARNKGYLRNCPKGLTSTPPKFKGENNEH